jgi:hypothetical protein
MNTHAGKSQENTSKAVAHSLPKKLPAANETSPFIDNRLETIAQRKLQKFANDGAEIKQLPSINPPVQRKENNTGLPDNLKSGIENLSGMSMDSVKVHYNSSQPASLNALAYAQGTDIHIAPGQEKHLPHEAWHVVQQAQGRVKPTKQMKSGAKINDDSGLEREADVMGAKALQMPGVKHDVVALKKQSSSIQRRSYSMISHSGDCPCSNCGTSNGFAQLMQSVGAGTVQLKTSVKITDANLTETGESGNEESARHNIAAWPFLKAAFDGLVHDVEMDVLDEEGEPTGEKYPRNRYMCAEPAALGNLLRRYDVAEPNHTLGGDYLSKITFPAFAVDDKTQKKILPCPVCQQWVTSVEPMVVKFAADMRNVKGIEAEKDRVHQEGVLEEQRLEAERIKEAKRKERELGKTVVQQKAETIGRLQAQVSVGFIVTLLKLDSDKKKWKKLGDEAIKVLTDTLLDEWINSLATSDVRIIKLYEAFDGGHQAEFQSWHASQ